jgi:hypothetical protein
MNNSGISQAQKILTNCGRLRLIQDLQDKMKSLVFQHREDHPQPRGLQATMLSWIANECCHWTAGRSFSQEDHRGLLKPESPVSKPTPG